MKNKLLLLGLGVLAFAGCKPDEPTPPDPGPAPHNIKACFTPSKTFIDSGETVTFVNCSENAFSWQWNFGGGNQTFDEQAPPQTYNMKPGKYPITLTVYSQDANFNDDTTITIEVARRSFSKIVVKRYPTTKSGNPWDATDGSSADVKLYFGPKHEPLKYSTPAVVNATGEITWVLAPPVLIDDTNNGGWVFKLVDEDEGGNNEPMATFGSNTDIFLSREGASPLTIIDNANYLIEAHYDRVKP